jgi:hypothetical protein
MERSQLPKRKEKMNGRDEINCGTEIGKSITLLPTNVSFSHTDTAPGPEDYGFSMKG